MAIFLDKALLIILAILVFMGGGCTASERIRAAKRAKEKHEQWVTTPLPSPEVQARWAEEAAEERRLYAAKRAEKIKSYNWDSKITDAVINRNVILGMTKEQVIVSWGGRPNDKDINRSVGSWGVHEQWIYEARGIYLYFENGILTSFQD